MEYFPLSNKNNLIVEGIELHNGEDFSRRQNFNLRGRHGLRQAIAARLCAALSESRRHPLRRRRDAKKSVASSVG